MYFFNPLSRVPFEVDRREGIRGYAGSLGGPKETREVQAGEGEGQAGGRTKEAAASNDAIFGQVTELHVTKGFPWAHHRDVSAQALHARDVVTKSIKITDQGSKQSVPLVDYLHECGIAN